MCGRYLIEIDEKEIYKIVADAERNIHNLTATQNFNGGEIYPTNIAPIISAKYGTTFMKWGYPSLTHGKPHINARVETVTAAKTFSDSAEKRRCLVPASGYFEWKPIDKKHKEKYIFTLPDKRLMYMAGVYSEDYGFAMLTRAASEAVKQIHNRMPVIIPHKFADSWLMESPDAMNDAITDIEFSPVDTDSIMQRQMSLF